MSSARKKKRSICSIHDEIEEIASDLEEILSPFLCKEHISQLNKIQDLAIEAKCAGERMEDRLKAYKDSIEALSFKRIKKK